MVYRLEPLSLEELRLLGSDAIARPHKPHGSK